MAEWRSFIVLLLLLVLIVLVPYLVAVLLKPPGSGSPRTGAAGPAPLREAAAPAPVGPVEIRFLDGEESLGLPAGSVRAQEFTRIANVLLEDLGHHDER